MKPTLAPRSVALSGHSALRLHSECSTSSVRRDDPCIARSREVEAHLLRPPLFNNLAGSPVNQVQPISEDVFPVACQSGQTTEFKTFMNGLFIQQIQDNRPSHSVSRLISNGKQKQQVDRVGQPEATDGQFAIAAPSTVTVLAYSKAESRWIRVPLSSEQLCDVHEMIVEQAGSSQRKRAERGRRTLMLLFKLWVGTYHVAVAIVHKHTELMNDAQKMSLQDDELRQMADGTAHKDEAVQGTADQIAQLQLEVAQLKGAVQQAHADTLAAQEGQRAAEQKQQQTQLELAEVKETLRQLEMDHRAAEAGGKLARTQLAETKNELKQALRDQRIAEDAQKEAEKALELKLSDFQRMEWDHKKERDARNREESAVIKMRTELSADVTNHSRQIREMLASLLGKDADVLPVVARQHTADDCATQESVWKATCEAIHQELTATETYAQAVVDKLKTKLAIISHRPKTSEDPLLQILHRKPASTAVMRRRPAPAGQIKPLSLPSDRPAANNQSRSTALPPNRPAVNRPPRPAALPPSRPAANKQPRSTALPPNRPAVNQPPKPAALPPSRPAANRPSRRPGLPIATLAGKHQASPAAAMPLTRLERDNQSLSVAGALQRNSRPARSHQSQVAPQTRAQRDTGVNGTVDDLQQAVSVHSKPCSRVKTTMSSIDPQLPLPANFMFDQLQPSSPTSPRLFVAAH